MRFRDPITALAVAMVVLIGPANAQAVRVPTSDGEIKLSFAPIVKRTAPSVVNVYTKRVVQQRVPSLFNDPFFRRFFGNEGSERFGMPRERIQNSLGSGVIVRDDGIVITNNHVIAGSDEITVVLSDRREFDAEIVGTDERTDLAVLRINNAPADLPALQLGDADALEVGDLVLAIGNPFGVGQTVTSGIVSAVARSNVGVSDFRSFIQTDAAINPGNSGGALVSIDGSLVGINTAIYSQDGGSVGIGFAIPTPMVRVVLDSILKEGRAVRAWLGAGGQSVSSEIAEALGLDRPLGVIVNTVYAGSPGDEAGIEVGDVLIAVNRREILDAENLRYRLATLVVGQSAEVELVRDGAKKTVEVRLVQPPENPPRNETVLSDQQPPFGGSTIANLNPALAEELGIEPEEGVIVLRIKRRSFARQAGLSPGDFILAINGRDIADVGDLEAVLARPTRQWTFSVKRGGRVIQRSIGL
ncbi:MAG: Do family serine endopeptidase [Alphaproteobacteria bacterium]|nr:Do family serine endopeptidase [Alphaproteobacteria bacterium]